MAYVPGYKHDVFISYAHGDDRDWINRLVDRLEPTLNRRLGIRANIWIDDNKLRNSSDFTGEIPDSIQSSAVFLLLPSPTYMRSAYCIKQECEIFQGTIAAKRLRFGDGFANDLFALRCPILPIDGNEHWSLFPGLSDINFCDESDKVPMGSPEFEISFRKLVGELADLLKRMRNHSTPVFIYPPHPGPELLDAHKSLTAELSARSYRILPDRMVNLPGQFREAFLSVLLLGPDYDESARELADLAAAEGEKPWVVWCSPAAEQKATADQIGFCAYLEQLNAANKTYLNAGIMPAKLKEEVLALLRPGPRALPDTGGKPCVYLVYNSEDRRNAGQISFHFRKEFHFEHSDDPAQHTLRLARSDGVLIVWGNAREDWCSREFAEMLQTSRPAEAKGLCLFDPQEAKTAVIQPIRESFRDVYIGEQFGRFDPTRLEGFFTPLLRRSQGGQA